MTYQDHKKYQRKPVEPVFKPAEDVGHGEMQVETPQEKFNAKREEANKAVEHEIVEDSVPVSTKSSWNLLTQEQQTGSHYIVAKTQEEEGTVAYWRRTRVMLHSRWTVAGKWTHVGSYNDLDFIPVYYKEIE